MRPYVPEYEMRNARSLAEALEILAAEPGVWRPFAGGTDLMVSPVYPRLLNIWNLGELREIEEDRESLTIGGLTTYTDVLRHKTIAREFPLLIEAARVTGAVATQNRGTLGGNIVNASPAADTPPALLVYDAEIELISVRGSRRMPYTGFHTGYKRMQMEPDELLSRIFLRRDAGTRWESYYRKVGTRNAQAISKVCMAALLNRETRDLRLAFGSVAPVPLRCFATEAAYRAGEDTVAALASEISPIDDIRSTAAYRLRVSQNLLRDFLYGWN